MKYCSKCGKEIMDEALICPECGCAQDNIVQGKSALQSKENSNNIGWSILCFFIPIVGLILYLVWKETSPAKAKAAGVGALVGFVVPILLSLIVGIGGGLIAGLM